MTYTVHVTLNYPEGVEFDYTHRGIVGLRNLRDIAEGYLREDSPTSWVFVVTKEETQ
jgi:hypothetical protein